MQCSVVNCAMRDEKANDSLLVLMWTDFPSLYSFWLYFWHALSGYTFTPIILFATSRKVQGLSDRDFCSYFIEEPKHREDAACSGS